MLRDRPDAVEADLRRFYGVSRHELTLLDLAHLLRHLPAEAVLAGNDGWSISDFLLADVVHSLSGQPHPADPRVKRTKTRVRAAVGDGRARAAARRKRLGIKGSVLRKRG